MEANSNWERTSHVITGSLILLKVSTLSHAIVLCFVPLPSKDAACLFLDLGYITLFAEEFCYKESPYVGEFCLFREFLSNVPTSFIILTSSSPLRSSKTKCIFPGCGFHTKQALLPFG